MSTRIPLFAATLAALAVADLSFAQCDLLLRDTFRFGPRPHGGNGRERVVQLEDRLQDYWPQVSSIGARWMSADQADQPLWQFAWSSTDPAEFDPAKTPDGNGIAFGSATAAVVIPFEAPSSAFTMAADVIGAPMIGFTSSPAFLNNLETNGALWIAVDLNVNWTLYANGSQVLASGQSVGGGAMNGGFYRVEMTYDPATGRVWGTVAGEPFGPFAVTLDRPMSYFGMEADDAIQLSWCGVNNLAVFTGEPLAAGITPPASTCIGGTATLSATSNAPASAGYAWMRNEYTVLSDGVQPSGAIISGSTTPTLVIEHVTDDELGGYTFAVMNDCGLAFSAAATLSTCAADFDCSGGATSQDFFAFLGAFFGLAPTADVNHDGTITSQDFFLFLSSFFAGCGE